MSPGKAQLIRRIEDLSDEDFDAIAPNLEADLDSLADIDAIREEVRLGRESAADGPLVDHAQAMQNLDDHLGKRR